MSVSNTRPRNICEITCGQSKHCGNRYCSGHPYYYGNKAKRANTARVESAPSTEETATPKTAAPRSTLFKQA